VASTRLIRHAECGAIAATAGFATLKDNQSRLVQQMSCLTTRVHLPNSAAGAVRRLHTFPELGSLGDTVTSAAGELLRRRLTKTMQQQ
jgi:hypothetical protein